MNRIASLLVVLTLIPSVVLAQAATGRDESGATATEPREGSEDGCGSRGDADLVGRVEALVEPKDGRVGVVFYGQAAVYRLPAVNPCQDRWMPLILQSLEHGTFVRMSFDAGEQLITRVTSASAEEGGWEITPDAGEGAAEQAERAPEEGEGASEEGEGSEPAPDREEP